MKKRFDIPVTIIIYNRPDKLTQLLKVLSAIQPTQLFVIADGPKAKSDDRKKVEKTRALIDSIEWETSVQKSYADTNMGLRNRISSGLDWVFNNVEYSIILEDDCIPNEIFFEFTKEMLTRYKDNSNVSMIGGFNQYPNFSKDSQNPYFFSLTVPIWGWATWNDRWKDYHLFDKIWSSYKKRILLFMYFLRINKSILNTINIFRSISKASVGLIDTWDYQWLTVNVYYKRLSIIPKFNTVVNLGLDGSGTNSSSRDNLKIPKVKSITVTSHPNVIVDNKKYTKKYYLETFLKPKIMNVFKRINKA